MPAAALAVRTLAVAQAQVIGNEVLSQAARYCKYSEPVQDVNYVILSLAVALAQALAHVSLSLAVGNVALAQSVGHVALS